MKNKFNMSCAVLSLLLTFVFCGRVGYADQPQKIALLVGVADYAHDEIEDLKYAENDIQSIRGQLVMMGFDVMSVTGKDATRAKVDGMIDQFLDRASQLESSDTALLMFSGHGQQLRATNSVDGVKQLAEVPYFCPVDAASPATAREVVRGLSDSEIAQKLNLVSLNRVIAGLDEQSNSLNNLLIVDACRNNPSKGKAAGVSGTSAKIPRGVNILFAAKSGQKSWESSDPKIEHGVFTHFLMKALKGEAKNSRNQVTWSRLASYLQDEVAYAGWELAGAQSRIQNPHSIINSDGLIVLGEAMSNKLIIERMYQSVTRHDDLLDMATLFPDQEFIVTPLWVGLWTAPPEAIEPTLDLLRPFYDSRLVQYLLTSEDAAINSEIEKHELDEKKVSASVAIANGACDALGLTQASQKKQLFNDCLKYSDRDMPKLACRVHLADIHQSEAVESKDVSPEMIKELGEQFSGIKGELDTLVADKALSKVEKATAELLLLELAENSALKRKALVGHKVPLLEGKDLAGEPINIREFEGKIVLLDVWAFW